MWTIRTLIATQAPRSETFSDHAKAREVYERCLAARCYQQVNIEGPGYGARVKRKSGGSK